ncbi:hypothetical protein [Flavobacterium sp.]
MSKNNELAQDYFDRHPASTECFITSDGRVFHQPGTAAGYATSLKDDTVDEFSNNVKNIKVKGAKVVAELTEEEIAAKEAEEKAAQEKADAKLAEDKAAAEKLLKEFNPETVKYPEAKALFIALGLTAESLKGEAINAALLEAQSKITE